MMTADPPTRPAPTPWALVCRRPLGHWLLDGVAFAVMAGCAITFKWEARDLVWGLWASSLAVGYVWLVVVIGQVTFARGLGRATPTPPPAPPGAARPAEATAAPFTIAAGSPLRTRLFSGLFLLGFFTVHFGGFHVGHAVFLGFFFPLVGTGGAPAPGILAYPATIFSRYWPVVLMSFVSRLPDFPWRGRPPGTPTDSGAMLQPYVNVVRMHLLIFALFPLHLLGLGRLAVIPILACYCIPWEKWVLAKVGHPRNDAGTAAGR